MFKVDKKYAETNIQKTVRFTEDLLKKLEVIAEKEDISFNTLVLQCCYYAIENMEPQGEVEE